MKSTDYYDAHAATLYSQYSAMDPALVHVSWAEAHLPSSPGLACDLGAGSGRDANWLAAMGWDVVAVEPSGPMRDRAKASSHARIEWFDDALPDLKSLCARGLHFDLVLLSAVWMHLLPGTRERAFRVLSELLKPKGVLVITLRHGSDESENIARGFYAVTAEEVLEYARDRSMGLSARTCAPDPSRGHIHWETLVFTRPMPP